MANFQIVQINGIIPAFLTSFDESENIDKDGICKLVDYLIHEGVHGFYLTGSTGEGFLMTQEERKEVVKIVIEKVNGRVPVIVHVGAIGTKMSIDLAKHAYETGADAVSSVIPFYYQFTEEQNYAYYKELTESTPLPMLVYNINLSGIASTNFIKKLSQIDGIKGMKFTSSNHYQLQRVREHCGDGFRIFSGMDEMALSGLLSGANGLIGSFYNVMPEVFIDLLSAFKEGNIEKAQKLQFVANDIIELALKYDYYAVMKLILKWKGVDIGPNRKPFTRYSITEEEIIKNEFRELKNRRNISCVKFLNDICSE